ncbi:hypothetical protein [Thalassovita sp.]|jgi:uncharacterized protein YjiS (DUF1127 family)|uniref:hypothetical protein n=1 Tax=Thalassovita sp. TaxID=1979401 RepID=UPI003B5C1698
MAAHATDISFANHGLRDRIASFFAAIGKGLSTYTYALSRAEQVKALSAKTDEELAELGLTRDQIPQYVFRDLFYV